MCVCQNEGLIGTLCACQTILALESWKSVNVQKVSQTDRMVLGGPFEVKTGLNSIGIYILEVCESLVSVADRCIGLESVAGVQNRVRGRFAPES